MKHVTFVDKNYSLDKQMEGLAIAQAVVSGKCLKCAHYKRCSSGDATFYPPKDTFCMKRKAELLEKENEKSRD